MVKNYHVLDENTVVVDGKLFDLNEACQEFPEISDEVRRQVDAMQNIMTQEQNQGNDSFFSNDLANGAIGVKISSLESERMQLMGEIASKKGEIESLRNSLVGLDYSSNGEDRDYSFFSEQDIEREIGERESEVYQLEINLGRVESEIADLREEEIRKRDGRYY